MRNKILEVAYHRNGSGNGEGFHAVRFRSSTWGEMVGIVFEGDGQVAVLSVPKLAKGIIGGAFSGAAKTNAWDGGKFEPDLRAAVEKYEAARKGPYTGPAPALPWKPHGDGFILYPGGGAASWTVLLGPVGWVINGGGDGDPDGYNWPESAMIAAEGLIAERFAVLAPVLGDGE